MGQGSIFFICERFNSESTCGSASNL
uniref:Uncharacterized protein n=1 Tax=Arundo donax TaxID=35708 RepID=A0A0A9BPG4_ARUDO